MQHIVSDWINALGMVQRTDAWGRSCLEYANTKIPSTVLMNRIASALESMAWKEKQM
jgi:hypothetical protein